MKRWMLWLPFVGFVGCFAVIAMALYRPADRTVHSALVNKPLPQFALPPMIEGKDGVTTASFVGGGPRLLNVFASWCVPCIAEAPQLMKLSAMGVPIDAIAIRDRAPAVRAFLARNGDPYRRIGSDRAGSVQVALGSSGVPESFLVNSRGVIVRQYVGDIRAEQVAEIVKTVRDAR